MRSKKNICYVYSIYIYISINFVQITHHRKIDVLRIPRLIFPSSFHLETMAILFYPTIQAFGGRGVRVESAHVVIGHGVRTVLAVISDGELELSVARAHLYQVEIDAATVAITISFKIDHPIHPMQFL